MRIKKDRTNQILELLTTHRRMEVARLSDLLQVSQVTIRKDLDELESRGIIRREHGSVLLQSTDDIRARLAYHYKEKLEIARRASALVSDGDTIMIESGSCCALLADLLARTRKNLTIITNSAFIASYIGIRPDFQIILLGGIFQAGSQAMVGPLVRQDVRNFFVPRLFIGTDGYSEDLGFMGRDQLRAQAVRDMAAQAEAVVVLTESEKIGRRGTVPLKLEPSSLTLITDAGIPARSRDFLEKEGARILLA